MTGIVYAMVQYQTILNQILIYSRIAKVQHYSVVLQNKYNVIAHESIQCYVKAYLGSENS